MGKIEVWQENSVVYWASDIPSRPIIFATFGYLHDTRWNARAYLRVLWVNKVKANFFLQ